MIVDVKTTSDPVDRFSAAKTIIRFDYDLSAALYVDAFKQYTGKDHDFVFAFINKQFGDIGILKASEDLLENITNDNLFYSRKGNASNNRIYINLDDDDYWDANDNLIDSIEDKLSFDFFTYGGFEIGRAHV